MFQTFSLSCDFSLLENYVRQGEESEKSTGAVFHQTRDICSVHMGTQLLCLGPGKAIPQLFDITVMM
jgi:hypothetical protein